MTARSLYEAVLIELNKENAPNILLEQFNYFANKAINNYINKRYNIYDISQQTTDDLRVLKSNATLLPKKVNDCVGLTMAGSDAMATYEVIMPSDYLHILNCICVYKVNKTYKCYNRGDYWRAPATRLTADMYSQVLDNFWNKPTYKKPYYYIHNVNTVNDSVIHNEGEPEPLPSDENYSVIHATTPTNPYIKKNNDNSQNSNIYKDELDRTLYNIEQELSNISLVENCENCTIDKRINPCSIDIKDYEIKIINETYGYIAIIWAGSPLINSFEDIKDGNNTIIGVTKNGIRYDQQQNPDYDKNKYIEKSATDSQNHDWYAYIEKPELPETVNYILKHNNDYYIGSELYDANIPDWKGKNEEGNYYYSIFNTLFNEFYAFDENSSNYEKPESITIGEGEKAITYTYDDELPEAYDSDCVVRSRKRYGVNYYNNKIPKSVIVSRNNSSGITGFIEEEKPSAPPSFEISSILYKKGDGTDDPNYLISQPIYPEGDTTQEPTGYKLVVNPNLYLTKYVDDEGNETTYYTINLNGETSDFLKLVTIYENNEIYYAKVLDSMNIVNESVPVEEELVYSDCETLSRTLKLFKYIWDNDKNINGLKQKKVLLQEIQKLVSRGENNGTDSVPNVLNEDNDEYLGIDGNGSLIIDGKGLPKTIRIGDAEVSNVERGLALRYGNTSEVRLEIRYGTDNSVFELIRVYVDYIKAPQNIRLTQKEIDLTEDTSQMLEYPDYVCQEIVNELVHLIMENISDGRLQTHPVVTLSIANPAQQLAAAQEA